MLLSCILLLLSYKCSCFHPWQMVSGPQGQWRAEQTKCCFIRNCFLRRNRKMLKDPVKSIFPDFQHLCTTHSWTELCCQITGCYSQEKTQHTVRPKATLLEYLMHAATVPPWKTLAKSCSFKIQFNLTLVSPRFFCCMWWLKHGRRKWMSIQRLFGCRHHAVWGIIEWFGLEGTWNVISFQLPCHGWGCLPLDQAAQSPSNLVLDRDRASLGNLFQGLATLTVKRKSDTAGIHYFLYCWFLQTECFWKLLWQ